MKNTETDARAELSALFTSLNLSATVKRGQLTKDEDGWQHWPFSVSFRYNSPGPSDTVTLSYVHGVGITVEPNPSEVLAFYCRDWVDAQQPFEWWCADYGYDTDSRKAEKLWQNCRKCLPDGFLSRETIERLAELARDL